MRYFLLVFTFFPIITYTQNVIDLKCDGLVCSCKKGEDFSIDKAIQGSLSNTINNEKRLACIHHQLGVHYYLSDDYSKAIFHNKEALKVREQYEDGMLWKSCRNLGYSYIDGGYYTRGIEVLNRAFEVEKIFNDHPTAHRYMGIAYGKLGDFEEAENAFKRSIKLSDGHRYRGDAYNDFCSVLTETRQQEQLEKALVLADSAIIHYRAIEDQGRLAGAYNNKGTTNRWLLNYEAALSSYKKALKIHTEEDQLKQAQTLNNIATIYYAEGENELAIKELEQSLKIKKNYHDSAVFHSDYAANYENLGENYEQLGELDNALLKYQNSLINLTDNFRETDVYSNPKVTGETYFYSYVHTIRVLYLKARTAMKIYKEKGNEAYLTLVENTCETALQLHHQLQQQIVAENSRLLHVETVVPLTEIALEAAWKQQQIGQSKMKEIFKLMEKSKATVLLQSINEEQALQYTGLPDSLIRREQNLRVDITHYKQQIRTAQKKVDTENINRYEALLLKKQNDYNLLLKKLEKNHAEYYDLKHKQHDISLINAQKYLNPETAILEYFIGDSSLYILTIQQQKADLYRLDKPENWQTTLDNFRKSIIDKTYWEEETLFTENAHRLYKWLLKEPLKELNEDIKRLQIIPDGQLNYIPFGLLLRDMPTGEIKYRDLAYLLKDKAVGYAYSVALLLDKKKVTHRRLPRGYGGFAPAYGGDNYADLPKGREMVQVMADNFGGTVFVEKKATKSAFLEDAGRFQVLHLSAHGILDDENPLYSNLVFAEEEPLYAADLYNTRLNADLTILSACNTGVGKIKKGEGVMSLSRAFTYAGCPSLLMSLWSVPDESTAKLMEGFFDEIKAGKSKDKALQIAQLNHLNEAPVEQHHPVYWAGFIASGNMEPVSFILINTWWLILFGVLLITVIFFVQQRY